MINCYHLLNEIINFGQAVVTNTLHYEAQRVNE